MHSFKCLTLLILGTLFLCVDAQPATGDLSSTIINELRDSNIPDDQMQAAMNALININIKDIAINHEFISQHNDLFSNKIETKGITDQQSSGRCWLFAVLNTLRPRVIKKYKLSNFEFSQTYLFFWDKIEKANVFLEFAIETAYQDLLDREVALIYEQPMSDGGYWWYVMNLVAKYGTIPKEAMPETWNSKNSWIMNNFIVMKLREGAAKLRNLKKSGASIEDLRKEKIELLKIIYKMLVLHLGEPPKQFTWRYENSDGKVSEPKIFTPLEFYNKVVGVDMNEYVVLMHYPGKEYNRLYQFARSHNIYGTEDIKCINVDINLIKEWTLKSILDKEPCYFACDIVPDKYKEKGILSIKVYDYEKLYGVKFELNKEDRIRYLQSTGNHAMAFIGVDVQHGKSLKWLVEDSHGKETGHDGYWTMYDDWFDEYLYEVVLHKKYVPQSILAIWHEKPIVLPVWDPMAQIMRNSK